MRRILTGDVGGTKVHLRFFSKEGKPLEEATYPSASCESLEDAIRRFLKHYPQPVEAAVFDVAGPVAEGRAQLTNLGWETSEATLQETLGIERVALLNDLVAIAAAVPYLRDKDLVQLNKGERDPHGAIAIVAPGTGLGEAYLTWDEGVGRYVPRPSEGGHTDFAPRTEEEIALLRYLWRRYPHVSYERITSGMGLRTIHAFCREVLQLEEPPALQKRLAEADDPNPHIVAAAMEGNCPACTKTLDLFLAMLGAEAGNLALKVLARGGVYLGGGIPPRILPALHEGSFLRAFTDKGRMAPLLSSIPIYVILNTDAPLIGDLHHALDRWL